MVHVIKTFIRTLSNNVSRHKWEWNKYLEVLVKKDSSLTGKEKKERMDKLKNQKERMDKLKNQKERMDKIKDNEKKEGFPWE